MKTGDIVVAIIPFHRKVNGQKWRIIGVDFCNHDCFCLRHISTGKYLCINRAWLSRPIRAESRKPAHNTRKPK